MRAGTAMLPLLLERQEAVEIAVGLRTAARASATGIDEPAVRALVKLEQVLPAHLRQGAAVLELRRGASMRRPAIRRCQLSGFLKSR
jgi:predicted DNA-binding transcriptional regulator YafY